MKNQPLPKSAVTLRVELIGTRPTLINKEGKRTPYSDFEIMVSSMNKGGAVYLEDWKLIPAIYRQKFGENTFLKNEPDHIVQLQEEVIS